MVYTILDSYSYFRGVAHPICVVDYAPNQQGITMKRGNIGFCPHEVSFLELACHEQKEYLGRLMGRPLRRPLRIMPSRELRIANSTTMSHGGLSARPGDL